MENTPDKEKKEKTPIKQKNKLSLIAIIVLIFVIISAYFQIQPKIINERNFVTFRVIKPLINEQSDLDYERLAPIQKTEIDPNKLDPVLDFLDDKEFFLRGKHKNYNYFYSVSVKNVQPDLKCATITISWAPKKQKISDIISNHKRKIKVDIYKNNPGGGL